MNGTPSPPPARGLAADWVEGRLAPEDVDRVAKMMVSDPAFRAEVEFVRMVAASGRDLPLVEPPPILRQRLRQSFQQWHRTPVSRTSRLMEVVASLVFDSRVNQLGLATRGAATGLAGDTVHLMWQCDLADLMVEAGPADEAGLLDLRGQVLLNHDSGSPVFTAAISGPYDTALSVDADDVGRFSVRAHRDATELRVSNGEITIIATLDLHPEEDA